MGQDKLASVITHIVQSWVLDLWIYLQGLQALLESWDKFEKYWYSIGIGSKISFQ